MLVVASNFQRTGVRAFGLASFLISASLLIGCAAPLAALGSASTASASTAGTAATTAAVANPATATSVVSTITTGKSPLEHATSAATKKDCSLFNLVGGKAICIDVAMPGITDKSEAYLGPADLPPSSSK
ncbi:hypothetical protein [Polynucleobacter sp. AP-Melu-500A-A1]|uniref:hypothetical protein n=1 Tax=Polynucleobacter sp. AP-Melu-500A-A1 TaxID=2576929 RepID=UPI001C0D92CE|nr:hypothetical protein [Polynucleobacter sp. AP-Melu-500A-A1]MBU3630740.1 hypothetical protein [Polynucleobacter sp. AP-Melu-500A-A1]